MKQRKRDQAVKELQNDLKSISQNLNLNQPEALLEQFKFSDVTLFVDGQEFGCNKSLLRQRCPFFAAMFQRGFLEYDQNCVHIAEVQGNVFKEFLNYIYTGNVPTKMDQALGLSLMILADKVFCVLKNFKNVKISFTIVPFRKSCNDALLKVQ